MVSHGGHPDRKLRRRIARRKDKAARMMEEQKAYLDELDRFIIESQIPTCEMRVIAYMVQDMGFMSRKAY